MRADEFFGWLAALDPHGAFLPVLFRILPIVVFSPLFGGAMVIARHRVVFAVLLALALQPVAAEALAALPERPATPLVLLHEALLGSCAAIVLRVVFEVLATVGAIADLARGSTVANLLDPVNQQQASLLTVFWQHAFLALFLAAGGARTFLRAFAAHLQAVPPGTGDVGGRIEDLALHGIDVLSATSLLVLRLAMPVLGVTFLVDIAFGFLNRLAPQVQVFFLSLAVKGLVGIAVIFALWQLGLADTVLEVMLAAVPAVLR